MENLNLSETLKKHLNDIETLRYGDIDNAELLYLRTKMFSNKFFGMSYSSELIGLKFRVQFSMIEDPQTIWNQNVPKLKAIAKTMFDDYTLSQLNKPKLTSQTQIKYVEVENTEKVDELKTELKTLKFQAHTNELRKKKLKKRILFWGLLIFLSFLLWTFNSFVHWEWLELHQKRIAIYIGLQFLLCIFLVRIIAKNKIIDIATIIAIVFQIIALL